MLSKPHKLLGRQARRKEHMRDRLTSLERAQMLRWVASNQEEHHHILALLRLKHQDTAILVSNQRNSLRMACHSSSRSNHSNLSTRVQVCRVRQPSNNTDNLNMARRKLAINLQIATSHLDSSQGYKE